MDRSQLVKRLFELQDNDYRQMQIRTIPSVDADAIIGVRTPDLRAMAKELNGTEFAGEFLSDPSHQYFEENQLHAFLISLDKDFDSCIGRIQSFLPYVDNWATCDQMIPKVFRKNHDKLLKHVNIWIKSRNIYTVRFAIKVLMDHFLDEDYDDRYPEMVARVKTNEYYLQMMIAWYFATALTKQYDSVLAYMEEKRLSPTIHKMTVRKCCDSFRIPDEHKKYLRSL